MIQNESICNDNNTHEKILQIISELNSYFESIKTSINNQVADVFKAYAHLTHSGYTSHNKEILMIYMKFTETINRIQYKSIADLKIFIENNQNQDELKSLSKDELVVKAIGGSCVFISYTDLKKKLRKPMREELFLGLIVECDWYLSSNQILFIRNNFQKGPTQQLHFNKVIFFFFNFK